MTTQSIKKPVRTLRDGLLKAAIWKNQGTESVFYSVTFERSYKDKDGNFKDTSSFTGVDLLRLSNRASRLQHHSLMMMSAPSMPQQQAYLNPQCRPFGQH